MDTDPSRPNTTLYISNLDPQNTTQTTLSEIFIPFGEITSISLPRPTAPSSTDLHRGFGYVEFEDAGDAKEALNNMDQSELFGRVIKVAMAKPGGKEDLGVGKVGQGSMVAVWEMEGYREKYSGEEGGEVDGRGDGNGKGGEEEAREDPMQGLEGLDVAGPRVG